MDDLGSSEFVADAETEAERRIQFARAGGNEHESAQINGDAGATGDGCARFCAKPLTRGAPGWTNTVQNEQLYAAKPLASIGFL